MAEVRVMERISGGLQLGVLSAVAATCAYIPMHLLGFRESFWGAITAIAVSQTELRAATTTARNQFFGAAVGGAVGYAAMLAAGDRFAIYAPAVVLSIVICWLCRIPTASQLAGVTCTIIFLVPRTGPAAAMVAARLSEVGWGVVVGICAVWVAERVSHVHVRRLRGQAGRSE